jgi:hypothetical protein
MSQEQERTLISFAQFGRVLISLERLAAKFEYSRDPENSVDHRFLQALEIVSTKRGEREEKELRCVTSNFPEIFAAIPGVVESPQPVIWKATEWEDSFSPDPAFENKTLLFIFNPRTEELVSLVEFVDDSGRKTLDIRAGVNYFLLSGWRGKGYSLSPYTVKGI